MLYNGLCIAPRKDFPMNDDKIFTEDNEPSEKSGGSFSEETKDNKDDNNSN